MQRGSGLNMLNVPVQLYIYISLYNAYLLTWLIHIKQQEPSFYTGVASLNDDPAHFDKGTSRKH